MYGLPSPLYLLENESAWPKSKWCTLVKTRVTVYYEVKLRRQAETSLKMTYLNVQLLGLSGRPHPALLHVATVQDVKKLRTHIKLLTGDFLTAERAAINNQNANPQCNTQVETISHILVQCRALSDVRDRLFPELMNTVCRVQPSSSILCNPSPIDLTQFILDCTSINLDSTTRVPAHNPDIKLIFRISCDWCYVLTNERQHLIQKL